MVIGLGFAAVGGSCPPTGCYMCCCMCCCMCHCMWHWCIYVLLVPLNVLLHVPPVLHDLLHVLHVSLLLGRYNASTFLSLLLVVAAIGSAMGRDLPCPFLYQLMAVEHVCMHAVAMVMYGGREGHDRITDQRNTCCCTINFCKLLVQ